MCDERRTKKRELRIGHVQESGDGVWCRYNCMKKSPIVYSDGKIYISRTMRKCAWSMRCETRRGVLYIAFPRLRFATLVRAHQEGWDGATRSRKKLAGRRWRSYECDGTLRWTPVRDRYDDITEIDYFSTCKMATSFSIKTSTFGFALLASFITCYC